MSETTPPPRSTERRGARRLGLLAVIAATAAATVLVMALWRNILDRQEEARHAVFKIVELSEQTVEPAEWGRNFPRQYDSYRQPVDAARTRHGGSEAFQKLEDDPRWRVLFEGYAFGVDYREERGHAFMLSDQDVTERVTKFKQAGACLHCHSSIVPAYRKAGREAGATGPEEELMKGFEVVCGMPLDQARKLVTHPVTCLDCHDPKTMALRVTRPGFLNGIRALAASEDELRHFPSIARWRQDRSKPYDPNAAASRQELRSMVCVQCHVEYYFKGPSKLVTYPWANGLKMEAIETYYDAEGWKDWQHPRSGAPVLKAQHPEMELWSQGIHARSGVACADCHMPYHREGAVKVSSHHPRSPLLDVARSCQTCHRYPEEEILARAHAIQDRTRNLLGRAEDAVLALIEAIEEAARSGAPEERLRAMRGFHRKAQWRLDFVAAENSMGFHAPAEAARILAEAIDEARRGLMVR